jgi:GMP synthase (glutamine-hydrolysing)
MILLVDLCYKKDSLSKEEFVKPIANIVKKSGFGVEIKHFLEVKKIKVEKVILCGVALKDNYFLEKEKSFEWIKNFDKPILGICAGMQIIAKIFSSKIVKKREIEMGIVKVIKEDALFKNKKEFQAYMLHNYSVVPSKNFEILARSKKCVQAIKHKFKPFYGILFHPEVRNEWVVERFLKL